MTSFLPDYRNNALCYCYEKLYFRIQHLKERDGVVVERQTPNLEVLGSIPTDVTVLCP